VDDPRTDPPVAADEAATLTGFLDFLRGTVALKTDGLTADQLRAVHPPSSMTLGGMLKHLAFVEDYWVRHVLLGLPPSPPWDTAPWDDDPDWDWHSAAGDDEEHLRGLWREAVERSRADLPLADLDRLSALARQGEHVSVRYVLVHLVEEYARHAGHADLLREALDGSTGE
jgi:hypothetical protein